MHPPVMNEYEASMAIVYEVRFTGIQIVILREEVDGRNEVAKKIKFARTQFSPSRNWREVHGRFAFAILTAGTCHQLPSVRQPPDTASMN